MSDKSPGGPVLTVVFYQSDAGKEPVRIWLKSLTKAERKAIGEDVKTAQNELNTARRRLAVLQSE